MSLPKNAKVVLFAGIFNISLTFFKYWLSSISGSMALRADMFSSVVILCGLAGGVFRIPYLDRGAALKSLPSSPR